MKKIIFIAITCTMAVLLLLGCYVNLNGEGLNFGPGKRIDGNGVLKEQHRGKMNFSEIDVNNNINVFISDNSDSEIIVSADENLIDSVITKLENGRLKISFKKGYRFSSKNKIIVTVPNNSRIKSIYASGTSSIDIESTLNVENFYLDCSGGSKFNGNIKSADCTFDVSGAMHFKGNIETEKLNVDCSGASNFEISGKADYCNFDISGASKISGYDFVVEKLNCDMSGASKTEITCNKELNIDISGASKISYKGNPGKIKTETSGASKVEHVD